MLMKTQYSYRVHTTNSHEAVSVHADGYTRLTDEDGLGDRYEFFVNAPANPAHKIIARFMRDKVVGIELHAN